MGTAVGVGDARGQRTGVRRELGRHTGLHVVVDTERVGSRPVVKDTDGGEVQEVRGSRAVCRDGTRGEGPARVRTEGPW